MLKSIALIMLIGMSAGWVCRKVKLPGLLGMLFTGIILGALIFRMAGVALCMAGTKLKLKERVFCMLAYTPKATVQAAIGGVPFVNGTCVWQYSTYSSSISNNNNSTAWGICH